MPSNSITIKPNNHRVYQCPKDKKTILLNKIIAENIHRDILVVCSKDSEILQNSLENKSIKVIEDKELIKLPELTCEMLISYDLPIKAIVYIARVTKATLNAILMLDQGEQKELYPIEMLLGRAIKQDSIEGFQYPLSDKVLTSDKSSPKKMTKDQIKEVAKKRYEKANSDDKETNKFLGFNKNGKAKFSGKSGERNHRYDGSPKEKYKTPKKPGRKINIKARKPSKED